MAVEKATVAVAVEEATVDKDKSSHRSIGDNSKDEGSDSDSDGSFVRGSKKIVATAPTRRRRWRL